MQYGMLAVALFWYWQSATAQQKQAAVRLISHPDSVAAIRSLITAGHERKRQDAAEALKNSSLGERYRSGDKSVVPEIIRTLQSGGDRERRLVYSLLWPVNRDEMPDYNITEPELIALLLSGIDDPQDEKYAVQLAGYMQLPGYVEKMEARLLSGQSVNPGRLLYYLATSPAQARVLDFIAGQLKARALPEHQLATVFDNLIHFYSSEDAIVREKLERTYLNAFHSDWFPREAYDMPFNIMRDLQSQPAQILLKCVLQLDNPLILPIAKEYLDKNILANECRLALIRVGKARARDMVLQYIRRREMPYLAGYYFKATGDDVLLKEVLIQAERAGEKDVSDLVGMIAYSGAIETLKEPEKYLSDPVLIKRIRDQWGYHSLRAEEVAADMLQMGLVDRPVSAGLITKSRAEIQPDYPPDNAWGLLHVCKLLFSWPTSASEDGSTDHPALFERFEEYSRGRLKGLSCWTEVKPDENGNGFSRHSYCIFGNKAYVFQANLSDETSVYDMREALEVVNTILSDAGFPERFQVISETEVVFILVFAEKSKLERFAAKYWP